MGEVSTIGLDIAKSVFQVHGVDADGTVVIRKRLGRAKVLAFFARLPSCLVGIEACPSAHYWSRKLQGLGHAVKLMPPSYVKAYLKRGKNDANDAAAICEAVTRPSMRFVPTKSEQQQSALMLHRSRQLLVRQRTMLSNAIRGHLAELGVIAAKVSKTGTIGFVGGKDIPIIHRFFVGYYYGSKMAKPEVKVLESYSGTFTDPAAGKEYTLALVNQGSDINFAVAGATTTRSARWPRWVWGMGSASDHRLVRTGSEANAEKVTSPTNRVASAVSTGTTWTPASTRRRHTSTAL